jgi:hypothetical protein
MFQANPIGDQSTQVFLASERTGKHIADEQSIGVGNAGVLDGPYDGFAGEFADRVIPVFRDGSLCDSNYSDFTHMINNLTEPRDFPVARLIDFIDREDYKGKCCKKLSGCPTLVEFGGGLGRQVSKPLG